MESIQTVDAETRTAAINGHKYYRKMMVANRSIVQLPTVAWVPAGSYCLIRGLQINDRRITAAKMRVEVVQHCTAHIVLGMFCPEKTKQATET
jgi:hypothetical protein